MGLGAQPWTYGNYTWHTNRDTYDKIVFDELRGNATLTAMLAYLASEDPTMIKRDRVDLSVAATQLAAQAAEAPAATPPRPGPAVQPPPLTAWPSCTKAPRVTEPRLK